MTIWPPDNFVMQAVKIYCINVCCNPPFYKKFEQSGVFEIVTNLKTCMWCSKCDACASCSAYLCSWFFLWPGIVPLNTSQCDCAVGAGGHCQPLTPQHHSSHEQTPNVVPKSSHQSKIQVMLQDNNDSSEVSSPRSFPNRTYSRDAFSDEVLWLVSSALTPSYLTSHTSLLRLPLISVSAQHLRQQGSSSFLEISKETSLALYGGC